MADRSGISFVTDTAFVPEVAVPALTGKGARPSRLRPSSYRGARLPLRRPRPSHLLCSPPPTAPRKPLTAVFLPPGGFPPIPDDDDELQGGSSDSDTDATDSGLDDDDMSLDEIRKRSAPRPAQQLHSIDRLLEEAAPDYETWVDRNSRRSLTTFRGRSQWTLGAEELNESLRPDFLQRHRHVLAPDEAFGALFMWDVVVGNSRELDRLSWQAVAEQQKLPVPEFEDIVRAEEMAPEAAVSRVFYWTQDWGEAKRCVFRKHELYEEIQKDFRYEPSPGIERWLIMLARYGVRCILCATRPKKRVEAIVSNLGLSKYFTKNDIISSEDEYDTLEQMILVGALKAERPPGKCVVFTDKPSGITAGHEVSAKVVSLIGAHPAYEMKTADQLVSSFDELVVYNIRRLFSEDGMELMDPQTELEHERK